MCRGFTLLIFVLFSSAALAANCPDLSGEYETSKIVQKGCESLELTQYFPNGPVVDHIVLDNVYRKLPSMPQLQTASTFNEYQLIFNSKDAQGRHVRVFLFSLTGNGDFLAQRIVLDGDGNIISSDGFIDKRQ
jgi:hypothetical protein